MKIIQLTTILCLLIGFAVSSFQLKHTCKNSNKLIGMKIMNKQDKEKLLHDHNKYRNYIASGQKNRQPPAENMLELTWDDFAEKQAFSWASGCVFAHNNPKTKGNTPMGQNLHIKMTTASQDVNTTFNSWSSGMVKDWYDEVKDYEFGSRFAPETGHYTQMVWAKTSRIGCGYSYYKQGRWYVGYLVCNYDPAGNYVGQNPYKVGKVNCKKHNLEPSSRYPHLCVKK